MERLYGLRKVVTRLFGYIRPEQSELLVKEYEFYKAVYCGICREGGKKISRLTRFFLNHDFVFLCVIRMAVTGEKPEAVNKRCPYGLKKKCMVCVSPSLDYTCAAFGLLMYYKALDDVNDSRGIKKFFKRFVIPFVSPMRKKASKMCPGLDSTVAEGLAVLTEKEKNGCAIPDEAADAFASLFGEVVSYGTTGEKRRVLYDCGYHIGRYVYLIDAFEDSVKDEKKNEYNVLVNRFGSAEKVIENAEAIRTTLNDSITAFCAAYSTNEKTPFDRLIYNISQLGSGNAYAKSLGKLKGTDK